MFDVVSMFVQFCLFVVYLLLFVVVVLLCRPGVDAAGWRMAKSFGLILLLLTLFAVALTNFSLGVCVALSLPLPSVLAQPRSTHER